MRAIQITKPGVLALVDLPDPVPDKGEIVVEVGACGICGTDLHIFDGEFPPTPYPIVPGHEAAGTIAGVGEDVVGFAEGDRVAIDPSLFCGTCDYCRNQRGNLCDRWGAIGDTVDGAFAERVRVPAASAYRMPEGMSFAAGALVEPVSCAVHALDRLALELGASVLIYGAGTMGLILAQLIRHAGAGQVFLVDTKRGRLDQAADLGFSSLGSCIEELDDRPRSGFDRVIDATGVASVVQDAVGVVRKGGTLMVFGVAPAGDTATFEPFRIYNQEITIVGSMAVLASYGRAIDLVAGGAVAAEKMVTRTAGLDEFSEALELVRQGVGLKTQIVP